MFRFIKQFIQIGLQDRVQRAIDAALPAQSIESLLIENGHVLVTVQIDPSEAVILQTRVGQIEQQLAALPGVRSARIILTAERPPQSATQQPSPAHTAIHMPQQNAAARPLAPQVKHIIAVASGKGGVGKSTLAANLAVALGLQGLRVGLLDADIYGPSVPTMFGVAGVKPQQAPGADGGDYLQPLTAHGIHLMSIGNLVSDATPMIWRGPMVQSAIVQLLRDVAWGALDVLVLDMPPGTGDAQLTVAQKIPLTGAVIVSTPQDIAWLDAAKGIAMFQKVGVPILGVVENMSQFCCPNCRQVTPLFGPRHTMTRAAQLQVPYLGDIPLDPDVQQSADHGMPLVIAQPDHPVAIALTALAGQLAVLLQQPKA